MANIRIRNGVLAVAGLAALTACGPQQVIGGPSAAPSTSLTTETTTSSSPAPSSSSVAPTTTTASSTVKPPTSTAPPPMTGFPNATNTGVPAGTRLEVVNGDKTFDVDNQVITGQEFRGFVRVTARNVTFRNSIFRGGVARGNNALLDTERGSGTVIENSEFVPSNPAATIDGLWTKNTSIFRSNIHGAVDGVKANSNTLIQDSYIHDMSWFASDPNQGGGETHNDGVQSFGGESNVTLRHNTIDMSTTKNANAALQSSAANTRVENNLLDGGGCILNFNHNVLPGPLTGIVIVNNRFGRNSVFKCPILLSTQTQVAQNSGNVWNDTGEPIPAPQRHD
ncbi:hypothetical protein Lesp02_10780 [Lentzea sp. NBRC 105346]|uniref:hypothetical protein n=1 Tax=Lentzea sp. NBRC 105346 TaxID=3032205 RepID=UPI0024A3B79A|nr:hypothetical protein [Lentzea sp. NBRC 105346]GLZ28888.1 hypothetical protein Lesp02_10780 [Lentzea sp. NBRC 105346]